MSEGNGEKMRQLIELAVACGRKRQSEQSGLVHLYYSTTQEDHKSIPIVENVLFALALMRTKTVENIQEAKSILDRTLHFQNTSEGVSVGNFPIYLHDYPVCKDRLLGAHLVTPFAWILRHFSQVLGAALKAKLEGAARMLIQHLLQPLQNPYHLEVKIAAGALALGEWFGEAALADEGRRRLNAIESQPDWAVWCAPESVSEILPALQLVYSSLASSPWQPLWDYLCASWHSQALTYKGPGWREYQWGFEPQAVLSDLYLGYACEAFSKRSLVDHSYHLQAALIQPFAEQMVDSRKQLHGSIGDSAWAMDVRGALSIACMKKGTSVNPAYEHAFHPFKMVWGSADQSRSFVCQGGRVAAFDYHLLPAGPIELIFDLETTPPPEEREKSREVSFFLDAGAEARFLVEGVPATTFKLGDEVKIETGGTAFRLRWDLVEGEGIFMGHLMRSNRPSQKHLEGPLRFQSYDWQIFLRTIKRSDNCRIKATLVIDE